MRVNEKIERITADTLICGIDIGKKMCCARFCDLEDWRCIIKSGLIGQKILMQLDAK